MNFWTDLIWVGNTLYPRWFVFAIVGVFVLTVGGAIAWVTGK